MLESGGRQAHTQITPGFQQAESDILERAKAVGEGFPEQAAFFDQLKDQMGNLEQEVEDLTGSTLLGVGVFEIEAAIFLDIDSDFPTQATTLVGQGVDIVLGRDEIGQPLEGGRPGLCTAIGFGFLANHHIQVVATILAICIGKVLDPAKILHNLELSSQEQTLVVFWHMWQHGVVRPMHVGQVLILQHNQVAPVVIFTELESAPPPRKETIQQQTDR